MVNISSSEFTKICREFYSLNETMTIMTNPSFVQFSVDSDAGYGSIKIGQNDCGMKEERTTL